MQFATSFLTVFHSKVKKEKKGGGGEELRFLFNDRLDNLCGFLLYSNYYNQ